MTRHGHRPPRALRSLLLLAALTLLLIPELAAATRCLTPDLPKPNEDYAVTRARLEAEGLWQPGARSDRTPPPNPQVGDTWLWYVWDLGGFPTADLKPCTVRGMGDHCYVVVDDDEWNVGMDQADVDRIVQHFDDQSVGNWPAQGIWDLNTSHFGDPPNPLDGLDRIFLFYYRFNISADGYFWAYDQYPDGSQPFASNECDVVYLAVDNGQPAGDYMLAVGAHEFEHMIHFARDQNESAWVDEGLGELAMWLFGHPDQISAFNTNPDNSLTDWGSAWADYIQCYLWTLYVYEQFGGQPFIWDLIHNPLNGMAGYQATVTDHGYPDTMEEIFRNWSVANYLDDPSVPNGEYGYLGDELPPFHAWRTHDTYPASSPGSVLNWAAEYVRLADMPGAPILEFDGLDTRDFRVTMMALDPVLPTLVREVPLDANNNGTFTFTEALGYDEAVISVANVYPSQAGSYNYTVSMAATDAGAPATPQDIVALRSQPNPFNPRTELIVELDQPGRASLRVHDARGRLVARLWEGDLQAGQHRFPWIAVGMPSGVYSASLVLDGELISQSKLALLK